MDSGADTDTSVQLDIEPGTRTPHVNGRMIALAREALGMTVGDLAQRTGASTTSVGNWESGRKQPSQYLQRICNALGVTVEFLSMSRVPVVETVPAFRSERSPEKVKDQAIAYALLQYEVAMYLDRRVHLELRQFPVRVSGATPRQAARGLRDSLGLGGRPISNVVREAERFAPVSFAPQQRVTIDAFSLRVNSLPLIVLMSKGDYYRQRWDVAHELGHLVMHEDTKLFGKREEVEAHQFAAEFLLPEESVLDLLPRWVNDADLADFAAMKETWGVSISALVRRSNELGLMPDATFRHWEDVRDRKGWRRREPGLMERTEASRLLPDALERYLAFGVPRTEVIREIGLPAQVFEAVVSRFPVAVGPALPTIGD